VCVPLPVDAVLPDLLGALEACGAVLLLAPPGAGKTTRVPPALLSRRGAGRVLVLEPRRVAARAAARRIAEERGAPLGTEVGYQVRFDARATASTRLLVATEGVVLRLLQSDPLLEGVEVVVFDEFHERSLASDLALAMTWRIRTTVRPDLRVVVMSATIDPGPLAAFLGGAPVVETTGREHPVAIEYAPPPEGHPLDRAVRSSVREALGRAEGDVLVFLPGVREIRRAAGALENVARVLGADLVELHGELPPERQDLAIAPHTRRRIVLATNVAETSLTLPDVRAVVDTGLERRPRFDPAIGLPRIETVRISRASAEQRAGRAGRTAPGLCLRLWSRTEDARLEPRRPPEILRTDLSDAVLQLAAWGETDVSTFPWFEAPPRAAIASAYGLLERLGAVESGGRLTRTGRRMAAVPAHPRIARMLTEAEALGHARRIALAAAMLSSRLPPPVADEGPVPAGRSDVLDLVESLESFQETGRTDRGPRPLRPAVAREASRLAEALLRHVVRGCASATDPDEAVLRAVLSGWPDRLARRREPGDARGVLVGGRGVRLAPTSCVRDEPLFVCVDADAGPRGPRAEALVRLASGVERTWLAPEHLRQEETVGYDPGTQAVTGTRRTCYEDLVLDEVPLQVPRGSEVEAALVAAAAADLSSALPLEAEDVASLRARVACLRAWRPDLALPDLGETTIREILPILAHGRRSFAELRRAPLIDHLRGRLTHEQQRMLDREAPERIQVPSGSRLRLRYEPGRPPVLAVRIQELFGLRETPRVAAGRVKVLLHLLAPNQRPQQITDDLSSFWRNTYPQVRAEYRRRHPRHAWPDDPLTAKAERRPARR
jgi:ATP-dependent helicase HrpB